MKQGTMIVCAAFAVLLLGGATAVAQDNCFCGFGADGQGVCFEDEFCLDRMLCASDGDCEAGQRCWIDNACPPPQGAGSCAPVCDEPECVNPARFDGFEACEPPSLLVVLETFEAEFSGGVVHLRWTTSSEIDNLGFRVFRARQADPRGRGKTPFGGGADVAPIALEVATPHLIPARGTELGGAEYRYSDTRVDRPGTVYFFLEDVDRAGKATLHGPVAVQIPAGRVDDGRRTPR